MKQIPSIFLAVLLALTGCSRHSDEHAHESGAGDEHGHAAEGVTFSEKRGLRVPAETAAFIGLQVADVAESVVKSEFRFAAQVYRATSDAQLASLAPAVPPRITLASGDVSPADAKLVQVGKAVAVELDSGGSWAGRITEIHAHTDKAVEHFDVTVAIDDPDGRLRAGTFVAVKATIGNDTPVVSVPRSALLETAEGKFVYTTSGEHFVRAAVKTGVVNEQFAEITDGLYAGDRVVVAPAKTLWMAELQSVRGGKACADGH